MKVLNATESASTALAFVAREPAKPTSSQVRIPRLPSYSTLVITFRSDAAAPLSRSRSDDRYLAWVQSHAELRSWTRIDAEFPSRTQIDAEFPSRTQIDAEFPSRTRSMVHGPVELTVAREEEVKIAGYNVPAVPSAARSVMRGFSRLLGGRAASAADTPPELTPLQVALSEIAQVSAAVAGPRRD